MTPRIFHVSDRPDIEVFEPRAHPSWPNLPPRVWAVEERMLHTFFVPRDCPRITWYATNTSTKEDVDRFLDGDRTKHVMRVEEGWLDQIKGATLFLYDLPPEPFSSFDPGAGYWTSEAPVTPHAVSEVSNLLAALTQRRVDFATLPSLWNLYDTVAASSLQFSMIRMRNSRPRNGLAEMELRRLETSDMDAAEIAIREVSGRAQLEASALEEFLNDEANYLLAALVEGKVVGSLNGYALRRPYSSGLSFLLYEIDVAEDLRNRGIGKELVREFARLARAEGAKEVWVLTNESNRAATATYEACGFIRDNRDDVMYSLTLRNT